MKQQNSEISRISQHLDELNREHRRKQALQTSIIFGGIIVLLLIGLLVTRVFYFSGSSGQTLTEEQGIFALEELSPEMVKEYFDSGESSMIVQYGDLFVTLYSVEDYWDIIENLTESESFGPKTFSAFDTIYSDNGSLDPFVSLDTDNQVPSPEETPLAKDSKILIRGVRAANSALRFTISNYDPRVTYLVDFGDGDIEEGLGREFFHLYDKGGVYSVELKGLHNEEELFSVKRNVKIDNEVKNPASVLTQRKNSSGQSSTSQASKSSQQITMEATEVAIDPISLPTGDSIDELNLLSDLVSSENLDSSSNVSGLAENASSISESEGTSSEGLISSAASPEIYSDPSYINRGNQPLRRYKKTFTAPLQIASKMPSFPGGNSAMISFLNERIKYPQAAKDFNIEGDVFVQFIVDEEGAIRNMEVVRGLGYGCDKEALRIVKEMPRWIPGRNAGEIVPVICTIQINFSLI